MDRAWHRFTFGSFQCLAVADGTFAYPSVAFAANVPVEQLEGALRERDRPVDRIVTPYTCLVIETGHNRVLVDTGAGNLAPTTGNLRHNLAEAGIEPATIDTVILTHGHADHIGGNVDADGAVAFPNARFLMWAEEWRFWTSEPALDELRIDDHVKEVLRQWARQNLPPIRDRVELVDREMEIVPGITAIAAPGHTAGHMALAIASDGEVMYDLVDTVLDPLQLEYPVWMPAFDLLPDIAVATRRQLCDRVASEGAQVLFFHFPFPSLGHVRRSGDVWQWEPLASAD
jgi:glyoxylase-like metal-dependent hydrolase (beta-lactamase superfamily II)